MSPCVECPLLAEQPKRDPLAERRAYAAAMRANAIEKAVSDEIKARGWANVAYDKSATFMDVGRWVPQWARTLEGIKARVDEIRNKLECDYGHEAVEALRVEVKKRMAKKES